MFKKFLRALNQHLEEYLIALFLIAITFVMLLQIVMRYVFQHSLCLPHSSSAAVPPMRPPILRSQAPLFQQLLPLGNITLQ